MKKKKILSIIIIVFGISLILSGLVFSLNNKEISTSEKSNESNKKDDKIIPTNDEKNAISWIGHYKDQNGNEIGVVVKNFSNYEIFFLNQEEFILGIDSITQDELKKESDTLDIDIKKENDVIKATIDLKIDGINMNLEPETEFVKVKDDEWSGVYALDNIRITITNLTDKIILINYLNNGKEENQIIHYTNLSNGKIEDNTVDYYSGENHFIIKKANNNIILNYQGNNEFYKSLIGSYEKLSI